MKKIILAGAFSLLSMMAMAQSEANTKNPEERAKHMTERMTDELALTQDQQKKVYQVNLELVQAASENRDQVREFRQEHRNKLENILSEEQFAQLEKMQKNRKHHMRKQWQKRQSEKQAPSEESMH